MINLILAVDENNGIGNKGKLPWPKLKEDLKFFKKMTEYSTVIMGRKTFESLESKSLKNRKNIVLTLNHRDYLSDDNLIFVKSIEKALQYSNKKSQIFIIGGKFLFDYFWTKADRIYLSRIKDKYECDTFVNPVDTEIYQLKSKKLIQDKTGNGDTPNVEIYTYDKINN